MKNFSENFFRPLEVDDISGEYFVRIPVELADQLDWYEDTQIEFLLDGNELVLREGKDD